jgi:hypothetical protein
MCVTTLCKLRVECAVARSSAHVDAENGRCILHRFVTMPNPPTDRSAAIADHYAVLCIPRSASADLIGKAFRHLAIVWHPDKNEGTEKDTCNAEFRRIREAHDVLSDAARRTAYDAFLVNASPNTARAQSTAEATWTPPAAKQSKEQQTEETQPMDATVCRSHPQSAAEFFCVTCDELLCLRCLRRAATRRPQTPHIHSGNDAARNGR